MFLNSHLLVPMYLVGFVFGDNFHFERRSWRTDKESPFKFKPVPVAGRLVCSSELHHRPAMDYHSDQRQDSIIVQNSILYRFAALL